MRRRLAAVALAALALALVGCSGNSAQDAAGESAAQDRGAAGGAAGGEDVGAGVDELTATGVVVGSAGPDEPVGEPGDAAEARLQTFVAQVDLGVEHLDDAVAAASEAIEGLGGFAADEEVDLAGSERATVVYRVPAAEFRPALAALGEVGALRRQSIGSEDVTARYSDLESRVTTLRTSITRLQGFLAETTDVNQIASLEGELTRREAELESIESQRRVLADQVALSTITVEFDAARGSERVVDERPGFQGGLAAGWDAARVLVAVAAATVGFLVPLLPLIAVVALALWWIRRGRRRRAGPTVAGSE